MLHRLQGSVSRTYATRRSFSTLREAISRYGCVDIHPEVQDALASQKAVVALETTIVTHGMPYPTNLKTARSVETNVRSTGAVPATIGIIGGRVKIGLEPHELEYLADVERNRSTVKISRRDIGPAIALKRDGGTTCSATLIFAALAGIKVFATGGLGGVHRGGETTMDVSADLHELTRCPVGLVSAGVKSILDIGRTLEYLETLGVPVVSYASTEDFPAFYSRTSGYKSPWRVEDPITAAQVLYHQKQLKMSNGVLFAVPIPQEYQAVGEGLQRSVEQAVKEAEENGMSRRGKEATPWLLKRVGELTAGKSLRSNVALIENTAVVGGQIAMAYAELTREHSELIGSEHMTVTVSQNKTPNQDFATSSAEPTKQELPPAKLVVIGSAAVDVTARADPSSNTDPSGALRSTVPGKVSLTLGGVGRNVAEAAHRILSSQPGYDAATTALISPIGQDLYGRLLMTEMNRIGMRTDSLVQIASAASAVCNMILDDTGDLISGIADMSIIQSLDSQSVVPLLQKHNCALVALDANMSQSTLQSLVHHCRQNDIRVFFEPTSVVKSVNILPAVAACLNEPDLDDSPITYVAPNILELANMYKEAVGGSPGLTAHNHWWKIIDDMGLGSGFRMDLEQLARMNASEDDPTKGNLSFLIENGTAQMAIHLLPFFQHIIIKCGEQGVVTVFRVPKDKADMSPWMQERSNIRKRYVIGRGRLLTGVTILKHFPAVSLPKDVNVNVTGAGDSLVGSLLASLVDKPAVFEDPSTLDEAVERAQRAAVLTLRSQHAVSPALSDM